MDRLATGESTEMYLKAICELTAMEPLVPISTLADRLGISVVSATEMVHRMKDQDLLEHKRYKGVRLTKKGRKVAFEVIRSHRLWERFLVDYLKLPWEESHDLACQLEHAASPEVIDAMSAFLGQPTHCPHGNPIPNSNGAMLFTPGIPLDRLRPGQRGRVLLIRPETNTALGYLASHGIRPGVYVSIKSINSFDRLWTLEIEGREEVISQSMISRIVIRKMADSTEGEEDQKE
jgi:DtxR family Mn-dependent transcriptional regulator